MYRKSIYDPIITLMKETRHRRVDVKESTSYPQYRMSSHSHIILLNDEIQNVHIHRVVEVICGDLSVCIYFTGEKDATLEQEIITRTSILTKMLGHRCPYSKISVTCFMVERPRVILRDQTLEYHKASKLYFCPSGICYGNSIDVARTEGIVGLLTHELLHEFQYPSSSLSKWNEGITDFVACILDSVIRGIPVSKCKTHSLQLLRDVIEFLKIDITEDTLISITETEGINTTCEYLVGRVLLFAMIQDEYEPFWESLKHGHEWMSIQSLPYKTIVRELRDVQPREGDNINMPYFVETG